MIKPLRIFEGIHTNTNGEAAGLTSAVYPPQFYDFCRGWACALRVSFALDAVHFGYGKDAEHAIQRASEEARGFAMLGGGKLVVVDGLDFATFTSQGRTLPWLDDIENHPGLASYTPPPLEPPNYPTSDASPIRTFRGWQTLEGEMQAVVGAIYAPDCDAEGRWGCIVSCPTIIGSNKRISGVDAEQALEAADRFLTGLWNHFIERKPD